jgi:hypothetical protein
MGVCVTVNCFQLRLSPALALAALLAAALPAAAQAPRKPAAPPARKAPAARKTPAPRKPAPGKSLPLEQQVAAREKRAAQLAAARRWNQALDEIAAARLLVRGTQTQRLRQARKQPVNAAYARELAALQSSTRARAKKAPKTQSVMRAVTEEYRKQRAALQKKHGVTPQTLEAARVKRRNALRAEFGLVTARLADRAADYHRQSGNPEEAERLTEESLLERLAAYRAGGKKEQATQVAVKLAQSKTARSPAYEQAALYFQEDRQYGWGAQALQRAIEAQKAGRSGMSATSRMQPGSDNLRLAQLYRQLAFCYQKLERPADTKRAMEQAAAAEQAAQTAMRRR